MWGYLIVLFAASFLLGNHYLGDFDNYASSDVLLEADLPLAGVALVILACVRRGNQFNVSEQVPIIAKEYGVNLSEAHCIEDLVPGLDRGNEARETGTVFRWIRDNYENMQRGKIQTVIFHHKHENSWHQRNFSGQLRLLFGTSQGREYLLDNDFGDVYPKYGDFLQLPAKNVSLLDGMKPPGCTCEFFRHRKIRMREIMYALKEWTATTGFEWVNTTINRYHIHRSTLSSTFFVSARALLRHSKNDYEQMLERLKMMSIKHGNYAMSLLAEFSWRVLFQNVTWSEYRVPVPEFLGKPMVVVQSIRPSNPVFRIHFLKTAIYPECATCLYPMLY